MTRLVLLVWVGMLAFLTASPADASATTFATVRAAQFSPDGPPADVYLTAFSGGSHRLVVPGDGYASVSPYQQVGVGPYVVGVRPRGVTPSSLPTLSWTLNAKAGQAYTIAAIGSGPSRREVVLQDQLTSPPTGFVRMRVIDAAGRAPKADVTIGAGEALARGVAFGASTQYTQMRAGTMTLWAQSVQSPSLTSSVRASMFSGSVVSVVLVDSKNGGFTIRTVLDAASAPRPPTGSVGAGGGGEASVISGRSNRLYSASLPALAGLIAVGAAIVMSRTGRHRVGRLR